MAQIIRRTDGMTVHPAKVVIICGATAATLFDRGSAWLAGIPVEQVAVELDGEFYRLIISWMVPDGVMYLVDLSALEGPPNG